MLSDIIFSLTLLAVALVIAWGVDWLKKQDDRLISQEDKESANDVSG